MAAVFSLAFAWGAMAGLLLFLLCGGRVWPSPSQRRRRKFTQLGPTTFRPRPDYRSHLTKAP